MAGQNHRGYTKYLNELQQFNTDREFGYGQHMDEINSQTLERQEAVENALRAAEFGDYSFLQDMGIDTSNNPADFERQYTLALLAAEYGDFSGLEALGITPSAQNLANFNRTASGASARSSGSGGRSSGGNSGGNNGGDTDDTEVSAASAAMQRANANQGRVTSEADWNALVAAYGEDALKAAGYRYTGSTGGGNSGGDSGSSGGDSGYSLSDLNTNSVLQLGIGPISYQTVEQLVEQGKVEAYTDGNGRLSVRWMPGYNANNYKNSRSTAGGLMTLSPFLPTP